MATTDNTAATPQAVANRLSVEYEENASDEDITALLKTATLQESKLNQLNKAQLQLLCTIRKVSFTGEETNSQLVALLLA